MGLGGSGQTNVAEDEWDVEKKRILDQLNREAIMDEAFLEPETVEDQQAQMKKCESFSRSVFTKIIKPFIKDHLAPIIQELVD